MKHETLRASTESAQDKCLWLVGRRFVEGLTILRGRDLDDAIPALP